GLLRSLLATFNHSQVRHEGFKLLLLWINCLDKDIPDEILSLYSNAIPLNAFDSFHLPLPLEKALDEYIPQSTIPEIFLEEQIDPNSNTSLSENNFDGISKSENQKFSNDFGANVNFQLAPEREGTNVGGSMTSFASNNPVNSVSSDDEDDDLGNSCTSRENNGNNVNIVPPTLKIPGDPSANIVSNSTDSSNNASAGLKGKIFQQIIELEKKVHKVQHEDFVTNTTPILGNGTMPSVSDSMDLFEEIIQNILDLAASATFGIQKITSFSTESDKNSRKHLMKSKSATVINMWEIFKKHYLSLLFPTVARRIGMQISEEKGFATCPPAILQMLINFIIRWCLDSNSSSTHQLNTGINIQQNDSATSPSNSTLASQGTPIANGAGIPPTSPIGSAFSTMIHDSPGCSFVIKFVLLENFENREIVHEIIRQSLLLPFGYSEILRGGIHVLRQWITCA
ncbi:hypothetical protein HK096_009660, partial [Nowakowskiella sp. JEL0078]